MASQAPKNEDAVMDLNRRYSYLIEYDEESEMCRLLFDGPTAVKKAREKLLFKTPNESEDMYGFRLRRAVYDNWASVIVNTRLALLWSRSPRRQLKENLAIYANNIDGRGTSADTFFRQVCEDAAVDGTAWVCIDMTTFSTEEGQVATQRDVSDQKIRPYMREFKRADVLDYLWDDNDRALSWVVVRETLQTDGGPGYGPQCVDSRIVITRTSWTRYIYKEEKGGKNDIKKGSWQEHESKVNELGVVPMVPFYGVKEGDGQGRSVIKDIRDHCLAIYNKYSDRDVAEFQTNNPIPVVIAADKPQPLKTTVGNAMYIPSAAGDSTTSVFYLEPAGNAVTASRESERDLIRRIFEIALRQTKRDTAQVQDAESLKAEQNVFAASLVSVANNNQTAEQTSWSVAARWLGDGQGEYGVVEYNRDFDDLLMNSEMLRILSAAVDRGYLSLQTFLEILDRSDFLPDGHTVEEEIARIKAESSVRAERNAAMAPPAPVAAPTQTIHVVTAPSTQ